VQLGGQEGAAAEAMPSVPTWDTFNLSHAAPPLLSAPLLLPPSSNASVDARLDFLHQQLDSFGVDKPILNGLLLLGNGGNARLQGGAPARLLSPLFSETYSIQCMCQVEMFAR
jgi:hypothetical protein